MTQVTVLVTQSSVNASRVYPTIPPGANRKALLIVAGTATNNATMGTVLKIGDVVPTWEAGCSLGETTGSAAAGLFSLNEAQIAAMVDNDIDYSGGNLANPDMIAIVIQDTNQAQTFNKSTYSSGVTSVASAQTIAAVTRIGESWTLACVHARLISTATMTNPVGKQSFSTAATRTTVAYDPDTARSIVTAFTITSSRNYLFSVNFEPVPAQIIGTVNSGNPVQNGAAFNAAVTGYTGVVSASLGGQPMTGLSYNSDVMTGTPANWVDAQPFYDAGTNQTLTYVNGVQTASKSVPTVAPAGYTRLPLSSPVLTAGYLAGDIQAQTGRTLTSADVFYHTTYSNLVLNADTSYSVQLTGSNTIDLWVRIGSGVDAGKMFNYTVTFSVSSGVVVSVTPFSATGFNANGFAALEFVATTF